jgi:AcrR family transcriptional regulator
MAAGGKNPRERIYKTAVTLFSRYGYAAVGVRDIVMKANVNISMISYYYGGKIGILREIIERFFDGYIRRVASIDAASQPAGDIIQAIFRNIVAYIRVNTREAIIVFGELPHDVPEIIEMKRNKIRQLVNIMKALPERMGVGPGDDQFKAIMGPALISIAFSNFLFGPLVGKLFNVAFDDSFYERYIQTISTIFMHGVTGLAAGNRGSNTDNG